MKCAISVWNGRVAPVFDASEKCMIIDEDTEVRIDPCVSLPVDGAEEKALFLRDRQVATLICGAISQEFEEVLLSSGIELISFIAAPVDEVIQAWREGSLVRESFSMPGCGCPRRRCRRRRYRGGSLHLG